MHITEELLRVIVNHPGDLPPEEGGIIGCTGKAGEAVIDIVEFDPGSPETYGCSYSPDVSRLNSVIGEWQKKGISFCGIFHVHYFGIKTLSDGDRVYIEAIMDTMPESVSELFFPIVAVPERELIVYRATRNPGGVMILKDMLQIFTQR